MSRRLLICVGFALLVCLDLGIPISMLAGRAAILRNGTEVKLELTTRDPRDLFRGEYSQLAYAIGNLMDTSLRRPAWTSLLEHGGTTGTIAGGLQAVRD